MIKKAAAKAACWRHKSTSPLGWSETDGMAAISASGLTTPRSLTTSPRRFRWRIGAYQQTASAKGLTWRRRKEYAPLDPGWERLLDGNA
jgi:hypothetical protein